MTRHLVKRLPVDTGRSGWEAISRRTLPVRTLDADVTADWLVIGAGFAGLSAARRLTQARPGERIVVLDARELAQGPAGRNSGFMIDVPHNLSSGEYSSGDAGGTMLEMAQNRLAIAFAKEAAAEYGMSAATFDPSRQDQRRRHRAGPEAQRELRPARSSAIGEPLRRIDAAEMREITGSDYYLGGLYTPGAVLIQPADYIRALAAGLGSRIDLYENSPVVELARQGGAWTARTPKGSVTAPKVILGVNGLVQEFGHFRGRLMHVFTYASMTAPFRGKAGPRPLGAPAGRPDGGDGAQDHRDGRLADRDPHPLHLRPEPAGLGEAGRRDGRAAAALVRRALPRPRGPALRLQLGRPPLPELEPRPGLRRGGGGSLLRLLRERARHGQEHARRA